MSNKKNPNRPPPDTELSGRIRVYQEALAKLPEKLDDDSAAAVRDLLIARDHVKNSLTEEKFASTETLAQLARLDKELQAAAPRLRELAGPEWNNWRASFQPSSAFWWWFLDEQAEPTPYWLILLWIGSVISLAYIVEILKRSLAGQADALSVVLVAFLSLAVGGTVIQMTWQFVVLRSLAKAFRVHRRLHLVVTTGFIVVALTLMLLLPRIVSFYNSAGLEALGRKDYSTAVKYLKRAVSLDSDYPASRHNLGAAYEGISDYDHAIAEYKAAINLDSSFVQPRIKLARLYLSTQNDFKTSIDLLTPIAKTPGRIQPADRYAFYKNLGWAYFGIDSPNAEDNLRFALKHNPNGVEGHYLLGLVLLKQGKIEESKQEMTRCLQSTNQANQEFDPNVLPNCVKYMRGE